MKPSHQSTALASVPRMFLEAALFAAIYIAIAIPSFSQVAGKLKGSVVDASGAGHTRAA